ncbi:MAG: acyltransferase family protein [Acidimicrobiales bacterium]
MREEAALVASHFRLDIQGIRALAVLLVVIYHAGGPLTGGFVGVDVFFVVSGFVIGGSLFAEAERTGQISLTNFYRRRVRRLLPALSVTIALTLLAAVLLSSPLGPQSAAAGTGIAALLFSSNYYLATSGGGYFEVDAESNPLLHLWSLSVEEQFYFVLPAVVAAVWWLGQTSLFRRSERLGPRSLLAVVLVIGSVISLALSIVLSNGDGLGVLGAPERMAFYSTPTRFWEFTAGVLLALAGERLAVRGVFATAASVLGLVAIGLASFTFDALTIFPGATALVPVVGTVALILSVDPTGPIQRVLATAPAVWIGDRSYSWYLWHWPFIVFADVLWPSNAMAVPIAAVLSLVPAILSYDLIEEPIRRGRALPSWGAPRLLATATILPILIGLVVQRGSDRNWGLVVPDGWGAEGLAAEAGCRDGGTGWDADRCTFAVDNAKGTIFLVGDSHAGAAADGVIAAGNGLGYDVAVWYRTSCPIQTRVPATLPDCADWQDEAIATISERSPELVVIANRSTLYTLPSFPDDDVGRVIAHRAGDAATEQDEALGVWSRGLEELTSTFTDNGSRVLFMAVVPEYENDPRRMLSLLRSSPTPPEIEVLGAVQDRRGPVVSAEADVAAASDLVTVFDPTGALCGGDTCTPVADGTWLYADDHHLSPVGSRSLEAAWTTAITEALS